MGFFDFFNADDLDELPHEDTSKAFLMFVSKAQKALNSQTQGFDGGSSEENWTHINDARHTFMNVIVAAAKMYEVEPFASTAVTPLDDFNDRDFRQFSADLDHYVTQLMLGSSMRARRESTEIPATSKDRIRKYLRALRECVEKADLSDAKREQLLKKIDAFEAELEKRRLTLVALTQLVIAISMVPGGVWASGQVAMELMNRVAEAVGEAKVAEDEVKQLPTAQPQKALSPPRKPEAPRPRRPSAAPAFEGGFGAPGAGTDDDIPF
jgi:hypothetical protein